MNRFAKKSADRMTAVLERARDYAVPVDGGAAPTLIALAAVDVNPDQPRRHFDEAALRELASSIAAQGVLQPIMVRPVGSRYQIVFGERRFRASQLAGLTSSPALVKTVPDADLPVLAALENLQRADLNRFEEVRAKVHLLAELFGVAPDDVPGELRRLRAQPDEQPERVAAVEQLFAQLGGEQWRSFVVNGLPVLRLADLLRAEVEAGRLAYSKALLIARTPAEHHAALVRRTVTEGLSQVDLQKEIKLLSPREDADTVTGLRQRLTARRLAQLPRDRRAEAERLIRKLHDLLA